jgi:adenosine deaminase
MMADMDVRTLPKAELHLHVEGTLEPELVFDLAARNGVDLPWPDIETLRASYAFRDLADFLALYYEGMSVLRTREDFCDLALAYYERAAADGIRHSELFFDPQVHLRHQVALGDVIGGLRDAARAAEVAHGITGGLILCFLRDLGPEEAARMLELAAPYADDLLGVGLDSTEVGYPSEPFREVFAAARELGLHTVAHAGEEGPPAHIWGALDALGAERIDHGLRALEDDALVERLVGDRIPLTVCPLSSVRLRAVARLTEHPLRQMYERGLAVTVNSDDPAYFGGYLGTNFDAVQEALELSDDVVVDLCRNSIEASFADSERRADLLAELDARVAGGE